MQFNCQCFRERVKWSNSFISDKDNTPLKVQKYPPQKKIIYDTKNSFNTTHWPMVLYITKTTTTTNISTTHWPMGHQLLRAFRNWAHLGWRWCRGWGQGWSLGPHWSLGRPWRASAWAQREGLGSLGWEAGPFSSASHSLALCNSFVRRALSSAFPCLCEKDLFNPLLSPWNRKHRRVI